MRMGKGSSADGQGQNVVGQGQGKNRNAPNEVIVSADFALVSKISRYLPTEESIKLNL